jgi:hypothetical protein
MADISSISSQIQQLENSYTLWTNITHWLTAATIVVGVCIFIANYIADKKGAELNRLKEEQSQKEIATLRQRIADRFLTSQQQEIIGNAIRAYAGQKITVAIVQTEGSEDLR